MGAGGGVAVVGLESTAVRTPDDRDRVGFSGGVGVADDDGVGVGVASDGRCGADSSATTLGMWGPAGRRGPPNIDPTMSTATASPPPPTA